jgi:hypothetical protein
VLALNHQNIIEMAQRHISLSKVQIENDIIDDSDDEFASPTYDELVDLLKEYTQIIRKSKAKCDRLKDENEFLAAKYDIVVKAIK